MENVCTVMQIRLGEGGGGGDTIGGGGGGRRTENRDHIYGLGLWFSETRRQTCPGLLGRFFWFGIPPLTGAQGITRASDA